MDGSTQKWMDLLLKCSPFRTRFQNSGFPPKQLEQLICNYILAFSLITVRSYANRRPSPALTAAYTAREQRSIYAGTAQARGPTQQLSTPIVKYASEL